LRRLERYAVPEIGPMPVSSVGPGDFRAVLEAAGEAGLAKRSVQHLRDDLGSVFGALWRDEEIDENPGHKDARTHMRYVDLVQRGALPVPEAALPKGVSAWAMLKVPANFTPANDDPAEFPGDPRGPRTVVNIADLPQIQLRIVA
jgi:hypothetical protein